MMVWPALQVSIMWRSGRKSFSPQFPVCHVQNLVEVQYRKHGIRYQQNCWKGWKSKSQGFRVSDFCFCCYVSKFLKQLLPPREQQEASGNFCQVKTVLQSQSWELAVEARRGGPPLQKFTWLEPVCQVSLHPRLPNFLLVHLIGRTKLHPENLSKVVLSLLTPVKLGEAYKRIGRDAEQKQTTEKTYWRKGIICRKENIRYIR